MTMRKKAAMASLLVTSLLILGGCAQEVGDIDRTQPNKVSKSLFQGEWYIRHTMADVPPSTGFTVAGFISDMDRIKWEIQEDFLIARRAIENVDGVQEGRQDEFNQNPDGSIEHDFEGSIVGAWRIQSHFDIQRQYNSSTGEQSNVIMENSSDRHWNEREFMRVDWSQNLASEVMLNSMSLFGEQYSFSPVAYFVPETETDNPDRIVLNNDYIEITNKWAVSQRQYDLTYYGYGYVPYCLLDAKGDCGEEVVKVRTSIVKRTADREMFVPRRYDDVNNKKFQIFRTERTEHSDNYGSPYPARRFYANLLNIWEDGRVPMSQRKARPIKYYLGANYPRNDEAIMWAVRKSIADWNDVFEGLVTEMGYDLADDEDMVILCEDNPVREDSPKACREYVTHEERDGDIVRVVRDVRDITRQGYIGHGDLRFNMINMNMQTSGFGSVLGFAQFSNERETGETLSTTVTMLYPNQEWAITRMVDWFQMLNGDLPIEEWISGQHIREEIAENSENIHPEDVISKARSELKPRKPLLDLQAASAINPKYADFKERLGQYDLRETQLRAKRRIDDARERGGPAVFAARAEQLREAVGPAYQTLLEETIKQDGAGMPTKLALQSDLIKDMSLLTRDGARRKYDGLEMERLLSKGGAHGNGCFLHADMIAGVQSIPMFSPLAQKFKGAPREEIYAYVRPQYWYFVFAHEIGHDLGLEHNFAATTDALNFSENYWLEKARLGYVPEYLVDPEVREAKYETNQTLRASQYTTLMDYIPYEITRDVSSPGTDWSSGLGTADRAAIYYAYGDLVQVFDEDKIPSSIEWTDDDGNDYTINVDKSAVKFDREIPKKVNEYHYTYYPNFAYADADPENPRIAVTVDGSLGYEGVTVDGQPLTDDNVEDLQDTIFTAAIALARGRSWAKAEDVERLDLIEVPYRTCNNYIEGSVEWCNMHDFGVDMWERVDNDIKYNKFGYFTRLFAAERDALYTPTGYAYFAAMADFRFITNQHKHWINRALIENRPYHEFWYVDEKGGLDGFFASLEVVEFFQEYMATPNMPERGFRQVYVRNEDGELEEVPNGGQIGASQPVLEGARYYLNPDLMVFESMDEYNEDELDTRMHVDMDLGQARYFRSEYDPDQGYNYFTRAVRYGSWIQKLTAVEMVADPYSDIIGADTGADASYALNLATLFQGEMFRTLAGYITERPHLYANGININNNQPQFRGLLSAYEQVLPSPFSNPESDAYLLPDESFTSQLYATFYTGILFDISANNPFAEALNVMIAGEDREIPADMVEGVDYLRVRDIRSSSDYVVFRHDRTAGLFQTKPLEAPTWEMVEEIQSIYAEFGFHDAESYEQALADATRGQTSARRNEIEAEFRDARFRVENNFDKLDVFRAMWFRYGFRYPYL